ncbi:MAG: ATP-binding protein, partial [Burkholderiales bacterium]|nr:ATP-binding protein [Burkholderiales bacterium]
RSRISGPLIDRIDLAIEVPALPPDEIAVVAAPWRAETSGEVRARVTQARRVQHERQRCPNARLGVADLERHCVPDAKGRTLAALAMAKLSLSARAYHRILKAARTIADLAGAATIGEEHVAEAVGYRRTDPAIAAATIRERGTLG